MKYWLINKSTYVVREPENIIKPNEEFKSSIFREGKDFEVLTYVSTEVILELSPEKEDTKIYLKDLDRGLYNPDLTKYEKKQGYIGIVNTYISEEIDYTDFQLFNQTLSSYSDINNLESKNNINKVINILKSSNG